MSEPDDDGRPPEAAAKTPPEGATRRVGAPPVAGAEGTFTILPRTGGLAGRSARLFEPEQVLAGRFRIVRFLGAGGMGEVYEAEDRELREHVALKTVRPDVAVEPRALDGFMREVHVARRVTHPHVCRIFDVFHHLEGESDVVFVTMELLSGETLSQLVRREGRLGTAVALPLVRQMAAALAAAHAKGVVHRDFKCANVMLVSDPAAEGGVRAVVTDFGLARADAADDSFGTLHTGGRIAGTPAYMAPEQVSGGPVTPAIDVYALGCVMFEMVTGRPPFLGDSPLSTAVMRLKEPPPSPRVHSPELDRRWEAVILRCLEREPQARFGSALDVAAVLEGRAGLARRRRFALPAVLAVALAAAAGAWWWLRHPPPPAASPSATAPAPAAPSRRAVAVLGFRNLSGRSEAAWLSTAFAEMLTTELAAGGRLKLIPGESVARARIELALAEAETLAADTLARLRRNLGSDVVVTGSYLALGEKAGGRLRVDVRLQDAQSGEGLEAVVENGSETELADLVARCGRRLREALGAAQPEGSELQATRAAFSSNPAAARLYAEGLERLRHHDALRARELLEKAVLADPEHPLARSALAEAWEFLGYGERAGSEARRALELAERLPREERLLVEGRARRLSFDWPGAVEAYRTLWGFFPDHLDYGLRLAEARTSAGQAQEALKVVEELRRLPPPQRDDPRIDMQEAAAATARSDFKRATELTERAAAKAAELGAGLLAAEALLRQAWAQFRLGEAEAVRLHAGEAQRLFEAAGDRNGAADAVSVIAHLLWMQQGQHEAARRLYAQALEAYEATGNRLGAARTLMNSAGSSAAQGEMQAARRACEQALREFHEIANKEGEASALANLGELELGLGEIESSSRRHAAAADLFRAIDSRSGVAHSLAGIGRARQVADDLKGARTSFEQALAMFAELSEKGYAARLRTSLAELDVEQRRAAEAVRDMSALADEMQAAQNAQAEAAARRVLALALLETGRLEEARAAVLRAEALSGNESRDLRLSVAIVAGRILAASGKRAEAKTRLEAAAAEAQKNGWLGLVFEARLALGEIGAEPLAALEREARARGFLLIARKAAAGASPKKPPG